MALYRAIEWESALADANAGSPWHSLYKKSKEYREAIERKTWFESAILKIEKVPQ
jgi:hypothetical protein